MQPAKAQARLPQTSAVPPVFVVGTGRCGSTLLSQIIREHNALLSLSEVFSFATDLWNRVSEAFPVGDVSAETFWSILASCYPRQNLLLRHHISYHEVLYPVDAPCARFGRQTGIPALLQATLPLLSSAPDPLFDELAAFVMTLPVAPISSHYRRLFSTLTQRAGKRTWVERSGGSLRIIARLVKLFPEARFVHLVRDGRDCALSMSRHPAFCMGLQVFELKRRLGYDPFEKEDRSQEAELPAELRAFLPEHFSAQSLAFFPTPLALCGRSWSGMLIRALPVLARLPPSQVFTMHYEELLAHPETQLRSLITFLDPSLSDESWITRSLTLIHPPQSAWRTLPEAEQAQLQAACQAGFDALRAFHPSS